MKSWGKNIFAELVLFLVGSFLCFIAVMIKDPVKTILLSAGCSLMATAFSTFIMDKAQDETIRDVMIKEAQILDRVQELEYHNKIITNDRIIMGEHLGIPVSNIIQRFINSGEEINIDIMGLQLSSFWHYHIDPNTVPPYLFDCKKIHLRMIVQNPNTTYFEEMVKREGRNPEAVRSSIEERVRMVRDYNAHNQSNNDKTMDIRLLSYPVPVTITRINSELYVRPRLIGGKCQSSPLTDESFFERYLEGEIPFGTYQRYFCDAWASSIAPKLQSQDTI